MIDTITIESLGEFIDAVTPLQPDPATGRRRDMGIYHGSTHANRPLLTSLDRLGGTNPPHTKAALESHLLRNFVRYSRPHLPAEPVNEWEYLVIAQHHGLPTRLLDWSYSPLVAAHFATRRTRPIGDRLIWRLDWHQVHEAFGIPTLALLIEDLIAIGNDDREFTPWRMFNGDLEPFACMIEPPSLDARIVAQASVFTISSDPGISFDGFLEKHDLSQALTKLVVPEHAVPRFRDQLDLSSIDERRLFPDLQGVATALRRYYS